MNRKLIYTGLTAIVALASCQSSLDGGNASGSLSVSVSTEATKAAMSADELLANADVRIYKDDFSGMVRHYKYSQMPESVFLPVGGYRVDVLAGEAAKEAPSVASWDQKSYKGSAPVTIQASKNASVTVAAKVNSVVSNVSFDSSVSQFFSDGFKCTIGLSADDASQQLEYKVAESGKDGYFIASGFEPSLYWTFSGKLLSSGAEFTKSGTIPAVEGGKRYKLALKYVEKNGLVDVTILVDDSLNDIYDDIIFVPVSTGIAPTSRYDVWGGHFVAFADVDEGEYSQDGVFFEYREKNASDWVRSSSATRVSEGSYRAEISGLKGSTEYEYRLVVTKLGGGEEVIDGISTVTTDNTPDVPNSSFETLSHTESNNYYSFYDPASSDDSLKSKWWCSGNKGSTTVGSSYQITYPDTADKKDGERSVCLESRYVIVKFAAGNLFSGRFGETIGTSGGTVFFGRPFTARPTAMRLWVKYTGGRIDKIQSNAPSGVKEGDWDKASLRIALGTWDYKKYGGDSDSPILVNTTDVSTFVDFATDESTIAFGEKIIEWDESDSTNAWQQVTIPLDYHNTSKMPTHIVISFASSMYGDYFTGHVGSKLWVDKLELLYE